MYAKFQDFCTKLVGTRPQRGRGMPHKAAEGAHKAAEGAHKAAEVANMAELGPFKPKHPVRI